MLNKKIVNFKYFFKYKEIEIWKNFDIKSSVLKANFKEMSQMKKISQNGFFKKIAADVVYSSFCSNSTYHLWFG